MACRDLYFYSAGRPSQVWEVNPNALNAEATPRINDLAQPKGSKEVDENGRYTQMGSGEDGGGFCFTFQNV